MAAHHRIAAISRQDLAPAWDGASSFREILRRLGVAQSSKNIEVLRNKLHAFGLAAPAGYAKSPVWADKERLTVIVAASRSFTEVLRKLHLNAEGGNIRTLKRYAVSYGLSTKHFDGKTAAVQKLAQYSLDKSVPLEQVLVVGSTYSRKSLKRRLVKEGLLEYKCRCCGNTGMWCGKPLALQLEHKNGCPTDNRLENLEFLCPNCHSQTATHSGKRGQKRYTAI